MDDKQAWMTARLQQLFAPEFLDVEDESGKHAGHAGARPEGQTHYKITMVSAALNGLSRVEQHRKVNDALKEAFGAGLHALALNLKGN